MFYKSNFMGSKTKDSNYHGDKKTSWRGHVPKQKTSVFADRRQSLRTPFLLQTKPKDSKLNIPNYKFFQSNKILSDFKWIKKPYFDEIKVENFCIFSYLLMILLMSLLFKDAAFAKEQDSNQMKLDRRHLTDAFELLQKGKINEGILCFIKFAKNNQEIRTAIDLLENEQFEEAVNLLDKIFIDLRAESAYFIVKGMIFSSLNKNKEALFSFDQAFAATDNNFIKACALHNKYITLLNDNTTYKQAKNCLEEAISFYNEIINFPEDSHQKIGALVKNYLTDINEPDKNAKKPEIKISPESKVTIRYWKGRSDHLSLKLIFENDNIFTDYDINLEVGHVSIQTEKYYISVWPGDGNQIKYQDYFQDIEAEGRLPDRRIVLYTANSKIINSIHEFNKQNPKISWSLYGGSIFSSNTTNCAAMTYDLLKKAGFHEYTTKHPRLIRDLFCTIGSITTYFYNTFSPSDLPAYLIPGYMYKLYTNKDYAPLKLLKFLTMFFLGVIFFINGGSIAQFNVVNFATDAIINHNIITPNDVLEIAEESHEAEKTQFSYIR